MTWWLTCAVRSLVSPIPLEAFIPSSGGRSQLAGDLLHHFVSHGGADSRNVLFLADALPPRWNSWRNLFWVREITGRSSQSPNSVYYAPPEGRIRQLMVKKQEK